MKRHRSLHSLSREHHPALVQAYNMRHIGTELISLSAQEVAGKFLSFWQEALIDHFRKEEEILLPTLARFSKDNTSEITRLLFEHLDLRCQMDELKISTQAGQTPTIATLNKFGEKLVNHIRFEEDVFFGIVEEKVPQQELMRLLESLEKPTLIP
jgi:iron-sulfur cluster repair protein YtfE (RIC family)